MDIEELYGHIHIYPLVILLKADDIVQLLVLTMVEFLKSEIVTSLLPKLASTVPEFLVPDTVPDSLMPNIGPSY